MRNTLLFGAILLGLSVSHAAMASDLSATASVQGTSDSNVFRAPPSVKEQLGKSASDHSVTAEGLVALDKNWNDFQIDAHAAALYSVFARNTDLNNFGYDLGATALKLGSISSLSFDGGALRRLASSQEVSSTARSIQSITSLQGLGTRSLLGNFRAILGGDFTQNTNSDPRIAASDYRRFGVRFGLGYYSPTGNIAAIEARVARSKGLHDSPLTIGGVTGLYRSSYTERSVEGHLLYMPSVLLAFEGRFGVSHHEDRSIFHQNFTKPIGDVKATFSPRSTVQFSLSAQRNFQTSTGVISNGVQSTSATAATVLQITNSLMLTADYKKLWSTYLISITENGLAPGRKDQVGRIEGQLAYAPGSRFTVMLNASHEQRTSATAFYRYKQTVVSLTLQTRFGADSNTTTPGGPT